MKQALENALSKIGRDKYYHFIVGFFLYLFVSLLINEMVAMWVVLTFALAGEIRDYFTDGSQFDLWDIVATALPALLMYCIL